MSTKLLVPTDFSEVSHTAIQHAVKFASIINAELVLLHIVASREDVSKAHEKLEQETSICKAVDSCSISTVVRIGNIFDDIGDVASEIEFINIYGHSWS